MNLFDHNDTNVLFIEHLINELPHFVFWKDVNLVFRGCNKAFAMQFGYTSPEEIIGKTDRDFNWGNDLCEKYTSDDMKIIKSGVAKLNYEEEQKQVDGTIKTVLVSKKPVYNDKKEIIGVLGIYTDITKQKNTEIALKQALEKIEEAKEKEKEFERRIFEEKLKVSQNMAGVMAHELRTPIASFKLILDMVKFTIENPKLSEEEKYSNLIDLTDKGEEVAFSANSFIDMQLFKIRSMNNRIDKDKLSLCVIADDVADVLNKYPFNAGEKKLISFNHVNGFIYNGDKIATSHILFNLIKNTLKIIHEEDRGKITIRFDKSDEKYNKLIFEDDAKGVDPKFLPYMFDSFVYKDSTGKGTGLGLAYCKMVMEDYDGDIICESELGKYTRFTCLFPKVDMSEFDFA